MAVDVIIFRFNVHLKKNMKISIFIKDGKASLNLCGEITLLRTVKVPTTSENQKQNEKRRKVLRNYKNLMQS